jgi:phage baseplate assembly protein W
MTTGLRFVGPSRERQDGLGAGLTIGPTGALRLASGDDHVRQSILILLATRPGERVMRPEFGCPVDRLVFNPNDATTAGLAIHYVREALLRFEPRIEIVRLDAGQGGADFGRDDPAGTQLFITLDYRVRATQRLERLTFALDLAGPVS